MAPWSRNKEQAAPTKSDEEENPFVVFRRFADEQINALMQGFNAIPGIHASPSENEQLKRWEQDMREVREKMDEEFPELWDKLISSEQRRPGIGGPATEEARQAARALLLQARNANVGMDPDRILSLYQDHGETMVPVKSMPMSGLPIRTGTSSNTWLGIEWFRHSPYSPIQLEQHEQGHEHGSKWRAAFEDLLSAHLGKEQVARDAWTGKVENQRLYSAWAQSGLDWMLGLQCRGILPPQLPSLYNITPNEKKKLDRVYGKVIAGTRLWTPYGKLVANDFESLARVIASPSMEDMVSQAKSHPQPELSMYEPLLGGQQSATGQTLIATLTTTERTILEDGTIRTKRVLKKRFADGHEEKSEAVEMGRVEDGDPKDPGEDDDPKDPGEAARSGKKGRHSWFWS
ncbi:hypothetical protein MBLNU459_g1486t1 [Dothideomycetes sp. NU459]